MHLSKLTKVLQSFDRPRLTRLKKYIHSPYFPVYPPSITLFDYLTPLYPGFAERKMKVEVISKHHKGIKTLKQQETAGVRLLRTIEKFIALEEWQKSEAEITRYQLKGFKNLQLMGEFSKGCEKELEQLKKDPEQNFDIFFERHILTELSFNGFSARLDRTTRNDLKPIVSTLDEFYALKKLRYLCEMLNRHQMMGIAYEEENVSALFKILEPYTNSKSPYVFLVVNAYRMMAAETYEDSDLYYRLIKQLAVRLGPSPAIREMMGYAINRAVYWHGRGQDAAGSEYLWWVEWRMAHKLLLENGKLMPVTFRNMVSIAAINKINASAIRQMIDTYAPYLPGEYHDTYLAFANGLYFYSLKKYVEAIRCFMQAQAKEVAVFNSIIRLWHWRCSYECDPNDTDVLINHLTAFEKYVQRNRSELKHVADTLGLFIVYAMKLIKSSTREMQHSNLNDLQSEEYFAGKSWLAEQYAAKNKKKMKEAAGF